ncbi:hypothetical protein BH10PSE1_BH10PSE1_17140 [soil metagenome]
MGQTIITGLSAAAFALANSSLGQAAQPQSEMAVTTLDEVVFSARRTEENIQNVPAR